MDAAKGIAPLALALAMAAGAPAMAAGEPGNRELIDMLKALNARVDKLEKRNAELEAQLVTRPRGADDGKLAERVKALESANEELTRGLESSRISSQEPELVTRLKFVENQVTGVQQQARKIGALDGISVEGGVVGVAQGLSGHAADGKNPTVANWRGDLGITLPGGDIGQSSGSFFAQVRMGQGDGMGSLKPTFTGALNSTNFQQNEVPADNTTAILAQAWYQLDMPLDGLGENTKQSLAVTIGKQDPFVFFDQNTLADNEAERFLNNVFVHNPMLDSGGAIGADGYGFTPGVRVAYADKRNGGAPWSVSGAVYGAREGAAFGRSFTKPLYIGQFSLGQRLFGGLEGNYRVYAWHNGRYDGYDGSVGRNTGFGVSVDQRVTDDLALFGRYGHTLSGKVPFDRALTLGAELKGDDWGRGGDRIGLAWGWLRSARAFRRDAEGLEDFGYRPSGAEQVAELYYSYRLNDHLTLSPDFQYIRHPGADADADALYAFAIRALYSF